MIFLWKELFSGCFIFIIAECWNIYLWTQCSRTLPWLPRRSWCKDITVSHHKLGTWGRRMGFSIACLWLLTLDLSWPQFPHRLDNLSGSLYPCEQIPMSVEMKSLAKSVMISVFVEMCSWYPRLRTLGQTWTHEKLNRTVKALTYQHLTEFWPNVVVLSARLLR